MKNRRGLKRSAYRECVRCEATVYVATWAQSGAEVEIDRRPYEDGPVIMAVRNGELVAHSTSEDRPAFRRWRTHDSVCEVPF